MSEYDVFLSYNKADQSAVESIARRLREEAGLEPFLDRWHLVPGETWQEALEEALDNSRACAVFLGPEGLGTWENEEMRAALDIRADTPDYRVIPVLLPDARLPERGRLPRFLARLTWVDFRPGLDDAYAFHELVSGVKGVAPGPEGVAEAEAVCPFRGLQVFDEQHARFFFGREALTQHLVEQLRQDRFLAVLGPSGSGKSSLVRAGLLPQVREGALPDSTHWPVVLFKPGPHPLETLAARLIPRSVGADKRLALHQSLLSTLGQDERGLHRMVQVLLAPKPDNVRLLVVVDQLEELFTLCRDEAERAGFIDNLLYASAIAGGQTVAVVTLRADFFAKCAAYPALAARLAERDVLVGPMGKEELRRAMEGPAQAVGLHYEKGLVDSALGDLGDESGSLPLLQHTLLELWERRRGSWLTTDAYHAIGGVQGALAQRAETVYGQLEPRQQAAARRVLLRLTQPGEGTEDTRRRATLAELLPAEGETADMEAAVRELADARMLTTGKDEEGDEIVDVAHEALIRGWPRLQGWIDEDRAALRIHRRLTEATKEWEKHGHDEGYLYRGARLIEAEEWMQAHAADLNPLERAFLEASLAQREREAQEREAQRRREEQLAAERRTAGRLRWLSIGLVVAIVVAIGLACIAAVLAGVAGRERDRAQTERDQAVQAEAVAKTAQAEAQAQRDQAQAARKEADSLKLAFASLDQLETNNELALLVAVEAVRTSPTAEAANALWSWFSHRGRTLQLLVGHEDPAWYAAWSPDGSRIVTASDDGTARVWDVSTAPNTGGGGKQLALLEGHSYRVEHAAWSPDGTRIVTAGYDHTVRVWDVSTALDTGGSGAQLALLEGHTDGVVHAAWSPDGARIVTAGGDWTARVWDAESGEQLALLEGHRREVMHAAWDPSGTLILTAGRDGTARVWDADSGAELAVLSGRIQGAMYAAWDPSGTRIVTSGGDSAARVWDVATALDTGGSEAELVVLSGHKSEVVDAMWSPDGTRIVTVACDVMDAVGYCATQVWDADSGTELAILSGDKGWVGHAAWSPHGTRIVTAGSDGTARVWDVSTALNTGGGGAELALLSGHKGRVTHAAWDASGTRIVTTSEDGPARVWDVESGTERAVLAGHRERVTCAAWDPYGTRILTAGWDGTARVWDVSTALDTGGSGAQLALLEGHKSRVSHAAWSPDGERIVTAGDDGTARVWDIATALDTGGSGAELAVLASHEGSVWYAAWSPDGERIVTAGDDGTARVWDIATALDTGGSGAQLALLEGHMFRVRHAAWSPDGSRIVTASSDGTARVWDVATALDTGGSGAQLAVLEGHERKAMSPAAVTHAAWSPDGRFIVTAGDDDTARVWDVATALDTGGSGAELTVLADHKGTAPAAVVHAAWSPDGKRIVTTSWDWTARVWDVATAQRAVLAGHKSGVAHATWSPDGERILTASWDGTARVWDVATALDTGGSEAQLAVLYGHTDGVVHAAWNATGTRIVTASVDGTARVYDYVLTGDWPEAACQWVVRNMSAEEWERYMGAEPYRETCPGKPVPGRDY